MVSRKCIKHSSRKKQFGFIWQQSTLYNYLCITKKKQNTWVLLLIKNLTFKSHIEKIANKLRKFNGILYKTRDYFSKRQLLMFYDAYAKSIIEYGILIYGSASKRDLKTIHIIQKRILRTILWKNFCDWTQEEVIKYKIYSVYELYAAHLFKEVFNQIRDNSPMKLLDLDEMHGVKTTRQTAANILPTISFKTKKWKNHSRENLR